jgi:hypothetical protein
MDKSRQRSAGPLRGSTCGARIGAVGSSLAMSPLPAFRVACSSTGPRRRAGAGFVLGDELFRVLALGQHAAFVRSSCSRCSRLVFEKRRRSCPDTSSACREPDRACGRRSLPRNARSCETIRQASVIAEKVFEQNLRAQVEKVRRFVEQQQVRFVQQQRRELHARLPTAGKFRDRAFEIGVPFSSNSPATSPHFQSGWPLSRIKNCSAIRPAETDRAAANSRGAAWGWRMTSPFVEFFFAEQHAQQRTFAGAVAADKADFSSSVMVASALSSRI